MSPAESLSAWLVSLVSRAYLRVHARAPYKFITAYRILIRSLGRPLLRRVLALPPQPVPAPAAGDVCVHVLTKSNECLFALWSCRTLLATLERPIPVYIHDDGSLGPEHVRCWEASLPGVRVVGRAEADGLARQHLAGRPNCWRFRQANVLSLKLFDPWIVQPSGDAILLDSDVLFFRRPTEFVRWLGGSGRRRSAWNHGVASEPGAEGLNKIAASMGVRMQGTLNAGLGLVARESVCFDKIEQILCVSDPGPPAWLAEQRIYGLLSAIAGADALPETYLVADGGDARPGSLTAKHYVGSHRGFFLAEGVAWILGASRPGELFSTTPARSAPGDPH